MLKPKNCFGVVTAGALDWPAAGTAAATVNSAAPSVSARNARTSMDLPSPERSIPYQKITTSLDGRARARRTGLRHVRPQRRVQLVDRAVGIRAIEVRIADGIERIGEQRITGG